MNATAAAAALLVPAARGEGSGRDERRRPRQRRHGGALRPVRQRQPGRLLGRELAVRARRPRTSTRHPICRRAGRGVRSQRASRSALHITTNCADWTPGSARRDFYTDQLAAVRARTSRASSAPTTNRTHCIAWSDWAIPAEGRAGARHPAGHQLLLLARHAGSRTGPGFFTGSGLPMRFADTDGSLIDVYQATTQMTDESDQSYPLTIDTLLDKRARPAGLLRRRSPPTCTPTAPSQRARRDRRLGPGARRAGGVGTPDARLGRRAQRSSFNALSWSGTLNFTSTSGRRERPAGDGADGSAAAA